MYPSFGLLRTIHYFIIFCKIAKTSTAYAESSFFGRTDSDSAPLVLLLKRPFIPHYSRTSCTALILKHDEAGKGVLSVHAWSEERPEWAPSCYCLHGPTAGRDKNRCDVLEHRRSLVSVTEAIDWSSGTFAGQRPSAVAAVTAWLPRPGAHPVPPWQRSPWSM